ncbi:MAG: CPBP family intramembrane metalloprotease, partial [Acidimicrobiia bacterium]|nr:CPBP family intramembrane metalloprotease [Acidimicrobiia bacterium]
DRDLGLIIEVRDLPGIFIGSLMLFVLGALATPIVKASGITENPQGISEQLGEATGVTLLIAVLGAVVAAPILEEVMYRGLLQRALAARFSRRVTFFITAAVWALAHVFTVEPGTANFLVKVGIVVGVTFLLGLVLSRLADKDGRLGRAVLTHAGFNLTSMAVGILVGGV